MKNKIVDVKNMSVLFGDFVAVDNISFDVERGEIFGFLGANGAGKTTTIRVLCGLLTPSSGQVTVDGMKLVPGYENRIKQIVGYMSQRFTLYNDLSVKENFDFAAALRGLKADEYLNNRAQLLDFIGFDRDLGVVVKDLPGGIKQEVALCVALLHRPLIVFLDEPTAGVAPTSRLRFWQLIRVLAKSGVTIFVTTHYMDEAENCSRIALMRDGRLIAIDSPENLKVKTFGDSLYRLRAKRKNPTAPIPGIVDIWQPYGGSYHLKFKDGVAVNEYLKKMKSDWDIVQIKPSLEDVFIRLVEENKK
ncbi:MAG: ABC transporter ATP-binding protein [Alphaproteobacteria bacterium]|nr:ABC transporter ATP-binding protein [Alphaproteobacteria bacterium]